MPPKPKVKSGGKPEDVWKRTKGKEEEVEDEQGWSDEDNNGKKGKKGGGKKKASAAPEPEPAPAPVAKPAAKAKKAEAPPPPVHLRPRDPPAASAAAPASSAASSKKKDVDEPARSSKPAAPAPAAAATTAASSHDKTSVCRLKLAGNTFEALCFSAKIKDFRDGKCALQDVLADQDSVYRHAARGERFAQRELELAFETTSLAEMMERIVIKGQAQVSAEEMKDDVAGKRREVIAYLASKYVDPKTNRPHPVTRIESALDQFKGLTFDAKRSAADHAPDLVKRIISAGLPMKKLEIAGELLVSKPHHQPTLQVLQKLGVSVHSTTFTGDGQAKLSIGLNPNDLDAMNKELARVTGDDGFDFNLPVVKQ